MAIPTFEPYANEADSFQIGTLSIENRLDRVCLYGSLDLTKDAAGLESARRLKAIVDAAVDALERDRNLPERIELAAADEIDNPF